MEPVVKMAVSICDIITSPVKLVGWLCSLFVLAVIFTVGGYLGKYWIENPDLEVNERLAQSDFWIPNWNFWGSGFITLTIIVILYCTWETIKFVLEKILNAVFCKLPCLVCGFICCCTNNTRKVDNELEERPFIDP